MAEVKWIKITTDIFNDEKILLIESMPESDSVIVIWLKLLCLAGKQNNGGVFVMNDRIAYTDEMLASIMRRPVNTVRLALSTFEKFGMVELVDGVITIPNWEKHQNAAGLERLRESSRLSSKKYRDKQNALRAGSDVTVTSRDSIDKEEDIDKDKEKGEKRKRFAPPSLDDVSAFVKENSYSVDPQRFIDYYESNGWMVGMNKMKDWKATVRRWSSFDKVEDHYDPHIGKKSKCPHCKGTAWRNTQTGKFFCDSCRETIEKKDVVWE